MAPLFAYVGPDAILPAMSILAAIGGLLLTFFSFLTTPFRRAFAFLKGGREAKPVADPLEQDSPREAAPRP